MGIIDRIFGRKNSEVNLTKTNPQRASKVISYEQPLTRTTQDVGKWRRAIINAENIINPSRYEYYRLLKDVVIDSHLSSIISQRKNSVLCREVCFYNNDGTKNDDITAIFKKNWFTKMRSLMLDAEAYGFTLIDFGPLIDDNFPDLKEVPRQYVKPELNIVVSHPSDITGVAIDDPAYVKWNILIGERRDLGFLMKAAPWALWKKTVIAYWSEYCEKFGMPMRVGKTNINDETLVANMERSLKNMGSAFWAIFNTEDEYEIIEPSNKSAFDIYDKFIERANSEMSKLILSQTGTTEEKAFVGSAAVHQDVMYLLIESVVSWHDNNLNEKIKPFLINLGFQLNGYFKTEYEEAISVIEKAKMVTAMMPFVKFDKQYLEDNFDIKIESVIDNSQGGGPGEKKPLTNYQSITETYSYVCPVCSENKIVPNPFTPEDENNLIEGFLSGHYTVDNLPIWYYEKTAQTLFEFVEQGFGAKLIELETGGYDYLLLKELRTNIYVFSAAKTYQQARDLTDLLASYKDRPDLFKKEAKTIFENYNTPKGANWLDAEAQTAKSSALSAKNWQYIERDKKTLPYLEYQTVGDSRVRPEHAALDGIIRPVDDAFWSRYYPPNGWRCRCSTISHDQVDKLTPMVGFKQPESVPDLFLMNSGKDRIIFSKRHPYFKVAKGDKEFALNNFGLPLP